MYCMGRLAPNGLLKGKKAETRRSVDLTNDVQHVGTREVSLERAEEKSTVDRPGLVCSHAETSFVYTDSRHAKATLVNKSKRETFHSYLNREFP